MNSRAQQICKTLFIIKVRPIWLTNCKSIGGFSLLVPEHKAWVALKLQSNLILEKMKMKNKSLKEYGFSVIPSMLVFYDNYS